ncbi:hypothetical protein BS78_06G229800 [Paspalum vaginatum]|nr:hypothetical protein BS78_06G229800 [Paspalum vaginatum]
MQTPFATQPLLDWILTTAGRRGAHQQLLLLLYARPKLGAPRPVDRLIDVLCRPAGAGRRTMNWKRKTTSSAAGSGGRGSRAEEMRERLIPSGGDGGCVPRGCVAVLVGAADDEPAERLVVEVRALGQPCVRALLDMAEREFGYDQKGVLRIPCPADEFRRAVAADSHHHHHHRRCRW